MLPFNFSLGRSACAVILLMLCCSCDQTGTGATSTAQDGTDTSVVVNFGAVLPGAKLERVCRFRNETDNPCRVVEVKATCTCTVANGPRGWIAPGDSADFEFAMDAPSKEADVRQTVVLRREPEQLEPYRITGVLRVRNELSVSPPRISRTVHPGEPLSVEFTVENWTSQPWNGIEISGIDQEKFSSEFRFDLGKSKLPVGGPLQSFDCSLKMTSPDSSSNTLLKVIPTPMIDGKAVSLTHIGNLEILLHQESPGRAIPPVLVARRATSGRHGGSVKIVMSDKLAAIEDLVLSASVENAVETESKIDRIDANTVRVVVTGTPSDSDVRALLRVHAKGDLIAEVPIAFVE